VGSFTLFQDNWLSFVAGEFSTFEIQIKHDTLHKTKAEKTSVLVAWNNPYYDPEAYEKNGGHLSWTTS